MLSFGFLASLPTASLADVDRDSQNPETLRTPAEVEPLEESIGVESPSETVPEPSRADWRKMLTNSTIPSTAQSELFPEPQGLKANVDFWVDMYTKYTEKQAVIHDSEDLSVRYEVVDLSLISGRASRRYVSRQLTFRKKHYAAILSKLASKNGECSEEEECRVAALFGGTKDPGRYRDAIDNLRSQHGLSNRFRNGLVTSGRYMDEMRGIFKSHGLPLDLLALPHVESSFNVAAYSRVGAAGIWQFMRSTGRLFLRINRVVDERRDPLAATDGAARFLKSNYSDIGSWPLTVISYNHGKNGILHAKSKYGDNVEAIIRNYRGPAFGFASRNFYTEFLAARKIMQNPEKYFGQIDLKSPMKYSTVKVDGKQAARLASIHGMKAIAELNPGLNKQILRGSTPIPAGYLLRIPEKGQTEVRATSHEEPTDISEVLRPAPAQAAVRVAEANPPPTFNLRERAAPRADDAVVPENMQVYVAKRGDTLSSIARRFGVSVDDLKDFNDLHRRRVRKGQKLFVPSRPSAPDDRRVAAVAVNGAVKTAPDKPTEIRSAHKPAAASASLAAVSPASAVALNGAVKTASNKPTEIRSAPKPVAASASLAAVSPASAVADLPSLLPSMESLRLEDVDADVGVVRVRAEESLGHYANWAGITMRELLTLNGWTKNRRVNPGQAVKVSLAKVGREKFEENRLKHHQRIIDGFLASHSISGVDNRVLRSGQTIWNISGDDGAAPMWLLAMYNQDKELDKLKPGEVIRVPIVHRKES